LFRLKIKVNQSCGPSPHGLLAQLGDPLESFSAPLASKRDFAQRSKNFDQIKSGGANNVLLVGQS